jgi:hypothetical protein
MVDVVQKCAHLIEALNNAQPDAKVFRNHCLDISSCANWLLPQILNVQKQMPNLGNDPAIRYVLFALKLQFCRRELQFCRHLSLEGLC